MLYSFAITRKPGKNFHHGITTGNLGKPDCELALSQHGLYVDALNAAGLEVTVLEPDPEYPDGCFVEDMAVVTPEMAIITNSGAERRRGERDAIADALKPHRKLFNIESPGTVDGGDVMRADDRFFIGISGRTNEDGARQFGEIAGRFGYTTTKVPLDKMLHLKSGVAYLGDNRVMAANDLVDSEAFRYFKILKLYPDEEYAANCIRIDAKKLIIAKGYPKIRKTLRELGYEIIELEVSEFKKMDGGLTCLSLLF